MKAVAVVLVLLMLAAVQLAMAARLEQEGGITCSRVDASLAPCITFLTQGGEPGAACCSGVNTLKGIPGSTNEERLVCNCVRAAVNRYSNLKDDAAQVLPRKCSVSLNYPISRTYNCDP
ncbi:non-specific lipid-transfer protein 1-like [Capsicum annuum]